MRRSAIFWLVLAGCSPAATNPAKVEVQPSTGPADAERPVAALRKATEASECSLSWEPHRLGASVITIPPETSSRMMMPVLAALCACTDPGSQHSIVVDFEPERGRASAHENHGNPALDRCLEPLLGDGLYPAFEIGSDCIDCGPKRYGVFGGPPPEPPRGSRIRMPLEVDRRSELRSAQ